MVFNAQVAAFSSHAAGDISACHCANGKTDESCCVLPAAYQNSGFKTMQSQDQGRKLLE